MPLDLEKLDGSISISWWDAHSIALWGAGYPATTCASCD